MVATQELLSDEMLFPVPLTEADAKHLLLGAALREDNRWAENSGITPDTQGRKTAVAEPLSPEGKQALVVTRSMQGEIDRQRAKDECEALEGANLPKETGYKQDVNTTADAGVASKSTPPAGVDSSTSTAGGVLGGTAPPAGGADTKSAPTMGGAAAELCRAHPLQG